MSVKVTRPSRKQKDFWIRARACGPGFQLGKYYIPYPPHTDRGGKWLLFVERGEVDEAWKSITRALKVGMLGSHAKVSTARPNPHGNNPRQHVICVYTYDSDDEDDVMRVRESLRELGFTAPIPYKTDEATLQGKYRLEGYLRISKYYE